MVNTGRTCRPCDHVPKKNRKARALFACVFYGYQNNADHGSVNVLAVFACGGMVQSDGPATQGPTTVFEVIST